MSRFGCAISCSAMVSRYYGSDTDPGRLLAQLINSGGIDSNGCLVWQKVVDASCGKLRSYARVKYSGPADIGKINELVDLGYPLIVEVRYSTDESSQHFVVVTGRSGSDYSICDPIKGRSTLSVYDHWHDLARSIYGYAVFYPANTPTTAAATPSATTRATEPSEPVSGNTGFSICYYGNDNLQGNILKTAHTDIIDFDWGGGGPGLPSGNDYFSALFTGPVYFNGALYRFAYAVDDKIQIIIDGDTAASNTILDRWSANNISGEILYRPSAGWHTLQVKYAEMSGEAKISVSWSPVADPAPVISETTTVTESTVTIPTSTPAPLPVESSESGSVALSAEARLSMLQASYEAVLFRLPSPGEAAAWMGDGTPWWSSQAELEQCHRQYIQEHEIPNWDETAARAEIRQVFLEILGRLPSEYDENFNVVHCQVGALDLTRIREILKNGLPEPVISESTAVIEPSATIPTPAPLPVESSESGSVALSAEARLSMLQASYEAVLFRLPSPGETAAWMDDGTPWWSSQAELEQCHRQYIQDHEIPNWDETAVRAEIRQAFLDILGHLPSEYDENFNVVHCQVGALTVARIREILRSGT